MDTIANLLTKIKNASLVSKETVELPYSKMSEAILNICKDTGFVNNVKVFKYKDSVKKGISVDLSYLENGKPKISEIKRISKPGRRIYRSSSELKDERGVYGLTLVSTSRGLMPVSEAKKKKLGGELVCEIY
jgi:small subunit ribosomal protein S8